MKRFLLLTALMIGLLISVTNVQASGNDEVQRKSQIAEGTFPVPFSELGNVNTPERAAVSTGYYFVDSDDDAPDYWRPTPEIVDTTEDPTLWRRIMAGPRILVGNNDPTPRGYWNENPDEGFRFFRNPALPNNPSDTRNFFVNGPNDEDVEANATDSTDDAIAGPIPIGFGFYFNGLRYDSFYVSTNGIIGLTNRRYFYDSDGNRTIPAGSNDCYDPMSADWFEYTGNRSYLGHSGNGLNDAIDDDYGYRYMVCGGNPLSRNAGLRRRPASANPNDASLTNIPYKAAVIAPFWGDMQLSQYDDENNMIDDWGRVYFKRSFSNDKLIIYFINIAPVRTKYNPLGQGYNAPIDSRPGMQNYTSANAQVTLNRLDSSVTIVYERFDGTAVISGRGYPASAIFRASTCSGVRSFARHVDYGTEDGPSYPWGGEYESCTHYCNNLLNPSVQFPHNYLAIKFKQWKNTLRVVDIQYRVRQQDPEAGLDFAPQGCSDCIIPSSEVNNYELLAGEPNIGAVQPVAIIQNLSNEIQGPNGVNFQPQELNFRARFRIVNMATGMIVYNRLVPIDSTCLDLPDSLTQDCTGDPYVKVRYVTVTKSGQDYEATETDPILPYKRPGQKYNGIKPYGFVQVYFPPFEPNEFLENHIGRLRAFIIADPTNPRTGEGYGDEWPFDDTTFVNLFVMRRLESFNDDVNEFHLIEQAAMPSVLKWVNIEAEVSAGEDLSHYPLPPRGEYAARNNEDYTLKSPVIRMNRKFLNGFDPSTGGTDYKGDEIRSFPIDMRGKYGAVLSVSFQRTLKADDWPRGWSDQTLIGPEPRTFVNGDLMSQFGKEYMGTAYSYAAAGSQNPDWIEVQLMQPSPDGVAFITNVEDKRWQQHPRRGGLKPVTNMPAYKLWGSNGYSVGFLESDRDSSLEPVDYPNRNGFRPNMYDDGIDYEFQKAFIAIPDTFIRSENEGAKNFRFRIRVRASMDRKCMTCIPDDDDPFLVDNVKILMPDEITDLEVTSVKIRWPYTIAPASQATAVPIMVKVSNNTNIQAPSCWVKVKIFKNKVDFRDTTGGTNAPAHPWNAIYCRTISIPQIPSRHVQEILMPSWNARLTGPGDYTLVTNIHVPGGDLEEKNDTTYSYVNLRFGDVFAYDPVDNPRNDVPDQAFTGTMGRGLNLFGSAAGGVGNVRGFTNGSYTTENAAGAVGGSGSGQIAVKFELTNADTVYGYKAYFGILNAALDDIVLSIYTDMAGNQPGELIQASRIYRARTWDDIEDEQILEEYMTYVMPSPIVLPAGTYWAVIGQLGETGIELGASKARMGMRTTNVYIPPLVTMTNAIGGSGISLMIEKNFRKESNSGNNLINNNFFAFENTYTSGTWNQFMPTVGNPAYAHLSHYGTVDGVSTHTLSRGGWIPMLRPYLGMRSYSNDQTKRPCPDDVPVELTMFDGFARENGIDLVWETASEIDNYGFYIERRNSGDEEWNQIGFVKGAGNSSVTNSYKFFDGEVVLNNTYQYRLNQVDNDGSMGCNSSDIITVKFDKVGTITLQDNYPNPFSSTTNIAFNLPAPMNVKLEVLDVYGNVINTIANDNLTATQHVYNWDGRDMSGAKVANGTYIFRLTADGKVFSGKMTLIK